MDTIDHRNHGKKCMVSEGTHSSNECINEWYFDEENGENPSLEVILSKNESQKTKGYKRIAHQIPNSDDICGRSFEDAFILANTEKFSLSSINGEEMELMAWEKAQKLDKTEFALKYAIMETEWSTPLYIHEGLHWLASGISSEGHEADIDMTNNAEIKGTENE